MGYMTKKILLGLAVACLVGAGLVLTASAHTISGTPHADCNGITASFQSFPNATNTIVLTIGNSHTNGSFHGTSGTVHWDEKQRFSHGGVQTYSFSWSADGGGNAGPYHFDASKCVPPPTTTSTTSPPTTICVIDSTDSHHCLHHDTTTTNGGGPKIVTTVAPPAEAVPVQPQFTG